MESGLNRTEIEADFCDIFTGCQIQYSTQKNMKNAKTVTVNNKTKSYTMKKLSRNKKYYVRIRAYRTTGGQKYYSTWGSVRTVKVK